MQSKCKNIHIHCLIHHIYISIHLARNPLKKKKKTNQTNKTKKNKKNLTYIIIRNMLGIVAQNCSFIPGKLSPFGFHNFSLSSVTYQGTFAQLVFISLRLPGQA
jgi:hypothetical protein